MNFQDFCKNISTASTFEGMTNENVDVPEKYKIAVTAMIGNMKNRIEFFDRITVPPYIQAAFDKDYESILKEKLENGEVPEGIIYALTKGIYNTTPSELNVSQQAIIKVLTTYICIQN